jgi:hypothetical protein
MTFIIFRSDANHELKEENISILGKGIFFEELHDLNNDFNHLKNQ